MFISCCTSIHVIIPSEPVQNDLRKEFLDIKRSIKIAKTRIWELKYLAAKYAFITQAKADHFIKTPAFKKLNTQKKNHFKTKMYTSIKTYQKIANLK